VPSAEEKSTILKHKHIKVITATLTGIIAVGIGAVLAETALAQKPVATPAAAARDSYLLGMGESVIFFAVFIACISLLMWRANKMRRNEYANVNGNMDGYADYYAGALIASFSHSVNR
jgi:hypothetical protein